MHDAELDAANVAAPKAFLTWATGEYQTLYIKDREEAYRKANLLSQDLNSLERIATAETCSRLAYRAKEMGGFLAEGKFPIYAVAGIVGAAMHEFGLTLWSCVPLALVAVLATRDWWIFQVRSKAYKELSSLLR